MMRASSSRWLGLACCLLATSAGCDRTGISVNDDAGVVDASSENAPVDSVVVDAASGLLLPSDEVILRGEVCTSELPDTSYPVKVMFIVDTSGSMMFSDPSDANVRAELDFNGDLVATSAQKACLKTCAEVGASICEALCSEPRGPGRQAAVQRVVDSFKGDPSVEFSILGFNARVMNNGGACDGFSNDPLCISKGIESLKQADLLSDYHAVLKAAHKILNKDMLGAGGIERERTKYVIIFLSDSMPDPQCAAGCDNEPSAPSWCDAPRDQWCALFSVEGMQCNYMKTWFPAMTAPCQAYNTRALIEQRVSNIMALGALYEVGEIRVHTATLFNPHVPKEIRALYDNEKYDPRPPEVKTAELLQAMAKIGHGLYRNFTDAHMIDFLDLDYTSLAGELGLTSFIVTNHNAKPDHLQADSDGDGLSDSDEAAAKLDPNDPDTDGDGFNDKLELERRHAGFHPGNSLFPTKACKDKLDQDGDGLRNCEEAVLHTDHTMADTDRDRIPDGLEFLAGTDPQVHDSRKDPDFDGRVNRDEIRLHTNPLAADPASFTYVYDIQERPRTNSQTCYDFAVLNIHLATTTQGYNEILVYFSEGLADPRDHSSFQVACVRVRYIAPNTRDPADGNISLKRDDFMFLPKLLAAKKKARSDPTMDPCVGVPLP